MKLLTALSIIIIVLTAMFLPVTAEDEIVPLNQIERFEIRCIIEGVPLSIINGVRIEWDMIGEVGITQYRLIRNGTAIATIPSQCPNCNIPASYTYEYQSEDPYGVYMLIPDINSASYKLLSCEIPTAVNLTGFSAK